jgi:hypothetical protein
VDEAIKALENALNEQRIVRISKVSSLHHKCKRTCIKQEYNQTVQEACMNGLTHFMTLQVAKPIPLVEYFQYCINSNT